MEEALQHFSVIHSTFSNFTLSRGLSTCLSFIMQQKVALTEMKKPYKNGVHAQPSKDSNKGDSTPSDTQIEALDDPPFVLKASGYLIRTLLLDTPLIFLFTLLVSTFLFQNLMQEYLVPQLQLLRWDMPRDYTYYNRPCDENDITAKETDDLIVTDAKDAVEKTMTHGASVFPEILTDQTAQELRDYIMEQNKIRQNFDVVIQPEKRHSWGITPNEHPTVAKALNEILSSGFFRDSIEAIAGKDPAIVEVTQITNTYGAVNQHYHMDVGRITSASAFARNAVPSYSLFIPLQNTTKKMGATGICPGTHTCGTGSVLSCRGHGFQVFGERGIWPKGWGFLYNSALAHRGSAHQDPDGPERVIFMVTFLSRPRHGKNILETRYIADHFFNHWLSWGHTASDVAQAAKHITQPWQTLRTLGIYKSPGRKWGWDYLTVLLLYICNNEHEERTERGELERFLDKTGLARLPDFLQVDVPEFEGDMTENWVDYFSDLVAKWQWLLKVAYAVSLGVTSLTIILINVLLYELGARQRSEFTIKRNFGRLVLFHAIVLGVAWLLLRRASTSSWAKNIKSGRLYRTPLNSRGPELPSTLPLLSDVLTPDDFQSDYLDSWNKFLDYGHTGNRQWNNMIEGYSVGYNKLEPGLQVQLSSNLVLWARQEQRRILTKNHLNEWAELDKVRAERFAHKEVMKLSNPFVEHAVKWTEYLLSETKYGYWRDTAMHFSAIPSLLRDLQGKLLRYPSISKAVPSIVPARVTSDVVVSKTRSVQSSLPVLPKRRGVSSVSERSGIPPEPPVVEPYPSAWVQVGDVVESMYSKDSQEWFRGTISSADLETMTWKIDYFDDDSDNGVCHRCVRPFVPFTVGETIKYNDADPDLPTPDARIIGINNEKQLYDIELLEDKQIIREVPIVMLYRIKAEHLVYKKGSHVRVREGSESYKAFVLHVGEEGSKIMVGFEDGSTWQARPGDLIPDGDFYGEYLDSN